MENIDQIGKNSLEALSRDNLTERNKRRLGREIFSGAVALICLVTGLIFSLVYPDKDVVPALIYTIGVLVEGIPVAVAAVKGILTKDLTNAMEILVTIAIIACYFTTCHSHPADSQSGALFRGAQYHGRARCD